MPLKEVGVWCCILKPKGIFCVIVLAVLYLFLLLSTLLANDQNSAFAPPNGEIFMLRNMRKINKRELRNFLIQSSLEYGIPANLTFSIDPVKGQHPDKALL